MESVVGNMKVGAPLIMGAYGTRNDNPYPIVWLKGTPNGDFITQFTLDVLGFDAQEPDNTCRQEGKTSHQNWSWMGWYKSSWSEFFL